MSIVKERDSAWIPKVIWFVHCIILGCQFLFLFLFAFHLFYLVPQITACHRTCKLCVTFKNVAIQSLGTRTVVPKQYDHHVSNTRIMHSKSQILYII